MFFNTSKILDRATERNKTQKYVEIRVKGSRPEFVRLLEKWPYFEKRFYSVLRKNATSLVWHM